MIGHRTLLGLTCSWLVLAGLMSPSAAAVPVTIIGTNDLHGQVERVAALAGHVDIVRRSLRKQGGGVVLVDAGDMFQGTLESNIKEGAAVVAAYNHVGYDAVCIGNHEFDFGPVGDQAVVKQLADDPRGALKARAREARFPFLAANIVDGTTSAPVDWLNVVPTTVVKVGRGRRQVNVGIIGLSTVDTPKTTIFSNVRDLRFSPLAEAVTREASRLRLAGAHVVVVVAHAGGSCQDHSNPQVLDSCQADAEIMHLAQALPHDLVDVIVAGHTHQTMAHIVNGIPIIESWANGRGFGRVDLEVAMPAAATTSTTATTAARLVKVHPPRKLCGDDKAMDAVDIDGCRPAPYEGTTPIIDRALLKKVAPFFKDAKQRRAQLLGVTVDVEVGRGYDAESALGNLFADLMLQASPGADVALMNGGGIRANLPVGPLTYGAVFEMMPFDNRLATMKISVAELRAVLGRNLHASKKGGIFSTAGVQATVACDPQGRADVTLTRPDGRPWRDEEQLVLATTDFVALGGDGGLGVAEDRITVAEGDPLREDLVRGLKARGGRLSGDDVGLFNPKQPRLHRPGASFGRCGKD